MYSARFQSAASSSVTQNLTSHLSCHLQGQDYKATKSGFLLLGDDRGREVWNGELQGRMGFMSVVWNEACDTDVFQLTLTLEDNEQSVQQVLTTVPCTDPGSVPNCLWTVAMKVEARDEEPPEHATRRRELMDADLQRELATPETQALDDDIHLLSLLMSGDGDAHDHFHANGGRR